ncbi:putative endoglucanase [Aspergillus fischeri NRRL 181]|uniref:Probable xyloglucan-specific endo-beta-1,4-glucanase A n=2 Tax=Aspergillus fischeri TaxID=36630 RepID=XGEA_NEOFI|nr:endoglucanase, putative [Aspergillus fischeri NRRL 181]A1D4F1.1 RecName: Full=Probable xyloglucan-specific endo-beta-1,4-glucanase A; AltName: Full=Xyloglucanase A; AltName: Full=Xyloglucanendohydrolase A; Flags: Precursor [Aspergillus fischeri NRRL 181]EAW23294.1 endoglucanase, putative [Aspergillus fischeri NRRL 181]KAG2027933.1 hypothetical protein GB937_000381 [Aspergillus fischeri]QBH72468.1 xyloglucan-specific endo-beta-1,4-glucanase [Aspergillus fischeri]
MKFSLSVALSLAAATAQAATQFCDQWGSVTEGNYILYNNLWGQAQATSGSQCTTFESLSGNTIVWNTKWSWSGGQGQVKSFANAALQFTPKKLSSVKSIDSTWTWNYSGSNIVADVAYDMFLSTSPGGDHNYEIMVWLGALGGAGPISSTGSPIATPTVAGIKFNLYLGPNGSMQVYSFVAQSTTKSFSGDMRDFFTYLEGNQGLSSDLYLVDVQAGTEPFSGSNAVFTVSDYSVSVA